MSTYPHHPRLRKGAIVGVDPFNPLASVIVFQYNPSSLTRTVQANYGDQPGGHVPPGASDKARKLPEPPIAPTESITIELILDAVDQLEQGDASAQDLGIYPQLAALEMLLYPKSIKVLANLLKAQAGVLEFIPDNLGSLTLFIWGPKRVLPVQVTSYSVTEEYFDNALNPIRAKVDLGLDVLTYNLGWAHPASYVFLAHQVAKEAMATIGSVHDSTNFDKVL